MPNLTPEQLAALREAAEKATKGEWQYGPWIPSDRPGSFSLFVDTEAALPIETRRDNAAYIVAAQPRVMLELLAERERLREALSAAKGYMLNAKIDLETGTKKATTLGTLEGGLRMLDAVLAGEKEPKP